MVGNFLNQFEELFGKILWNDNRAKIPKTHGEVELLFRPEDGALRCFINDYNNDVNYVFEFGPKLADEVYQDWQNNGTYVLDLYDDLIGKLEALANGMEIPEGIMVELNLPKSTIDKLAENDYYGEKSLEDFIVRAIQQKVQK